MVKKVSRTTLKHKADKLVSQKVREIGRCELEGKDHITCTGQLQTMHIVGRSNYRLRWDGQNLLCGCSGHHMYYTNHPWDWNEFIKLMYPQRYEYLNSERNKLWDKDYAKVLEEWK
ncbi:MAG: hypothetical protein KW793_04585 [Candidatus Doudnabacteria bacterium]|nr:hypothetical protein [Candidatus Doudnabacteria bacterium]